MITRNMMAGGSGASAVFEFKYTVTTNASSSNDKKAALPVNLYGQTGVEISVDWGDGSTSVLRPSDYTASSSLASVHEYASAGTYQITASSSNWSDAYFLSCYADATISSANNANQPVYWWRRTLKSVDSPLPPVKGVLRLASASATTMTVSDNDLGFLFHRCEKMTSIPANLFENAGHIEEFNSTFYNCVVLPSIPAGLFDPCISALNFSDCFRYCTALTSIPVSLFKYCTAATNMYNVFRFCNKVTSVPADLFKYNTLVTNMGGAFNKCDALKNFQLCIGSPSVATVTDFIPNASGVTRIVCVPADSTTYTSFNSYKNTSNNITVSTSNADCGIEEEEIDDGTWKFTVDTEATASGEKKTGIPFNLYGQSGIELTVDWGDNTTSTLTPSNYTASDSTASVHEYAAAGEYTITVASNDWENTYLLFYNSNVSSDSSTKTSSLYWFRRTATSIDTKLPQIKGVADADTLTAYNNSLQHLFYNSNKITSIPSRLFDKNTAATDFGYCFRGCSSLQSIPAGLFDKNTAVTDFSYCFYYCSSLASIPSRLFDSNTTATNFYGCFWGCSSLASIPSGLFDKNTAATDFGYCFRSCSSLQSIPAGLFDKNTAVTNFFACFNSCTSLTSIPSGLFDKNTAVTNFEYCFYYCTSLQSIPSGLFDKNTTVTNFGHCFSSCTSLQTIPSGLFDKNTTVTNFNYCFQNCSSLASIPSGLFDKNTVVTGFQSCFYGCTNLLNFHLKIGSSSVTAFSNFVSNASNVERILCVPANSTTYTNATSFANASNGVIVSTDFIECSEAWEFTIDTEATASGEKKTGIPFNLYGQTGVELLVDWGDNTTSRLSPSDYTASDSTASVHEYVVAGEYTVTVVSTDWENTYLFSVDIFFNSDSNSISAAYWFTRTLKTVDTKLPKIKGMKLSDSNASLSTINNSVESLFYLAKKLVSIPSGLFDNNTTVTDFSDCFSVCSSLQSIPSGLFDNNTEATSFSSCFYSCSSIQSIPSGLFDNNTAVTDFSNCFMGCSYITSIPTALFANNTEATNFRGCFSGCSRITSIPSELFDNNTKATNFESCFYQLTRITSIPTGLFDKNTKATTFYCCFYRCSSLTSIPTGLFDKNTLVTSFNSCFWNCSSLTSIPSGLFDKNTKATNFDSCFYKCSSLTSIPSGLFDKNTLATTFDATFRECTLITSIPKGLFNKNTRVTSFEECFSLCSSLASIPIDLFKYNTSVTNFSYCFTGCPNLLDFHLKIGSSVVTSFEFINNASNVDRIICVPANSTTYTTVSNFANNSNGIIVSTDIINCAETWEFTIDTEATTSGERLGAIPFNLTPYGGGGTAPTLLVDWGDGTATTLTKNDYTSQNSTASIHEYSNPGEYTITVQSSDWVNTYILTYQSSIWTPTDINRAVYIWRNTLTQLNNILPEFAGVNHNSTGNNLLFELDDQVLFLFYGCSHLEAIPSGLFDNNTAITNFKNCLAGCSSITSIPSGLFDKHTSATYMYGVFSGCSSITSIPSGLFDKNTLVYSFENCFYGCSSLASIPSGLFDKNTAVNYFGSCFSGCSSITSIPSGLFDKNTAVENFSSCFYGCSSLASIPSGLFDKNTAVEEFGSCFGNCDALTTIPAGLFDKNTAVNNFYGCFSWCDALTTIPAGLFEKNTAVESFYNCFAGCRALTNVPSNLFEKNTVVTRFDQCFQYCSALLNFHLKIGSSSVTTFSDFIPNASNVDRILCVPANSTTYTTASNYANSSNNIIVSTDYIDCAEAWEFTIDTEAVVSGNKKSGIPFVLLHENADIVLLVDWGDGTSQRLTSANYTAGTVTPTHVYPDYRASVHTYAAAGRYTITVASSDWENTYLWVVSFADLLYEGNANSAMWWYRRTLVSVDTPFPKIKGTMRSNSTGGDVDYNSIKTANSFEYAFMGCQALTTIPSNLFDNNTSATNFTHCFDSCTAITSIPPAIFNKHINATGFTYCFSNCSSLASIPSNLFVNNTKTTDLYYTFYRCTSITSIPAGLFDSQINATRFDNCFYYCTSLISIPYNLFHKNTKVTGFSRCFSNCISLTSIPADLFDKNTSAADFSYCFENCTALTHIPAGLFDKNTNAIGFYDTFTGCTSLASVPNGLFANNTKVTNFQACFAGCTSLLNFHIKIGSSSVAYFDSFIPDASNVDRILCVPASSTTYTKATAFASASNGVIVSTDVIDCAETWEFTIDTEATTAGEKKTGIPFNLYGQTGIQLIVDWGDNTTSTLTPSDYTASDSTASVHEYATAGEYTVTVVSNDWENTYLLFYISSISSNSGTKYSSLYWFRRTATSIDTKLPQIKGVVYADTLVAYNNSLQGLFYYLVKITSIPSGLFDNNTAVTNFNYCFDKCTSLQSIPSGLFDNNTAVTSFYYCFSDCYSLQSIPSGLFDNNTAVTTFYGCFFYCTSLQSIPSGLFDNNTAVTSFYQCFSYCTSLQSIPSGLFDKNTAVTSFEDCFYGCSSLQSIPSGLFDNNTAVTSFANCFNGCTALQSIPSGLFDKNTAVTSFGSCFSYCTSLQSIPSGLFDKNTAVTRFSYCFSECTLLADFTLDIGSSLVTFASSFVTKKSGTTRTINVPANSATYTAFSNVASSLGLTIVGV